MRRVGPQSTVGMPSRFSLLAISLCAIIVVMYHNAQYVATISGGTAAAGKGGARSVAVDHTGQLIDAAEKKVRRSSAVVGSSVSTEGKRRESGRGDGGSESAIDGQPAAAEAVVTSDPAADGVTALNPEAVARVAAHKAAHMQLWVDRYVAAMKNAKGASSRKQDNTVDVTDEEIERARKAVLHPLGTRGVEFDHPLYTHAIRHALQRYSQHTEPIVVEFVSGSMASGGTRIGAIGESVAYHHKGATVISVAEQPEGSKGSEEGYSGAAVRRVAAALRSRRAHGNEAAAKAPSSGSRRQPGRRFLPVVVDSLSLTGGSKFRFFYDSCNMITAAVHVPLFVSASASSRPLDELISDSAWVQKVVEMSMLSFFFIPSGSKTTVETIRDTLAGKADVIELVSFDAKSISPSDLPPDTRLVSGTLVLVRLLHSQRKCRKTWGAPLVQWDRSLHVRYNGSTSGVSFHVRSESGQTKLARSIHPLQYIPSVNLDTVLGMGLSQAQRIALLGQMIRIPRYSDPLPHNWILAGRGELQRIDKVDLRYDKDVDESKGYWGYCTRGYLRLLAHHLCIPWNAKETRLFDFAAVAPLNDNMSPKLLSACGKCASTCSYLPKASDPCEDCQVCSRHVEDFGLRALYGSMQASMPLVGFDAADIARRNSMLWRPNRVCQIKYSSMHSGRRAWKGWEREDHSASGGTTC